MSKQETLEEAAVNFVLKHFLFPNKLFFKMSKCSQNDYLLEEEFGLDNTTKYREILGFIDGAKWQQERMYSEEDMKQFAFECVGKFLSNDDNKVEIKLVDVIIDRLNKHFEQFKKK